MTRYSQPIPSLGLVLCLLSACGGGAGSGEQKSQASASTLPVTAASEASAPASAQITSAGPEASAPEAEASSAATSGKAPSSSPPASKAPAPAPTPTPSPTPLPAPNPAPPPLATASPPSVTSVTSPGTVIPEFLPTAGGSNTEPALSVNALAAPLSGLNSSTALTASVSTARSFASYNWLWSLECAGKALGANAIAESGFYSRAYGTAEMELRFGKVPDPLDSSRRVLQFRAARTDPLLGGAPRCELGFSPTQSGKLPVNQAFWFAFGLHLPDWVPSSDAQIVAQWHTNGSSESLNPLFAVLVKGGDLHIEVRSNASRSPTKAGTTTRVNLKSPLLPISRWTYFVVQAKLSTDSRDAPFLRVWRDGTQIVKHEGPVGYNIPTGTPYAKIGHYHWIDSSNPWPSGTPVRTVLMRSPVVLLDALQRYSAEDLRGFAMAN